MAFLIYSNYLVMFLLPISGGLGFLCPVLGVLFTKLFKSRYQQGVRNQCLVSHAEGQGKKSVITFIGILSIYIILISLDVIESEFSSQINHSQVLLYVITAVIMIGWYITISINLIRFRKELDYKSVPIVYSYEQWKKFKSIAFEKKTLNVSDQFKYR